MEGKSRRTFCHFHWLPVIPISDEVDLAEGVPIVEDVLDPDKLSLTHVG